MRQKRDLEELHGTRRRRRHAQTTIRLGAHPPAADEARRTLAWERLKRLWKVALAAPSHARVVITYQGNGKSYISDLWYFKHTFLRCTSRPDLAIGAWQPQAQKKWGAIDSDFLA